jgi:hypothetical protein
MSRCSQKNLEDSPIALAHRVTHSPGLVACDLSYSELLTVTCRPMSQINPQSSRAMAAVTLLW